MKLNRENIKEINGASGVELPAENYFDLPEKVLQFGTGVLLRGLPDYFIDKANKQGVFNGRVVVVKSTATGGADAFADQDSLYTLCVRGIDKGETVDKLILNASISRVLSAADEWAQILECASNPHMSVVISNTTEVGIVLEDDDINAAPPSTFPCKLLAFLYKRFQVFNGSADAGMTIVPAELITDNGKKLKEIVLEQAKRQGLEETFINWLLSANEFCNTLVDRIVPGKLSATERTATEAKLGYSDDLMIMSEVYSLWAIETTAPVSKQRLSFSQVDSGVILTDNISKFKELKLRLLNGSHSFTCGLAIIQGFATVKEAMKDAGFNAFISNLMNKEIIPAIVSGSISEEEAKQFAASVLDRYSNPFLEHQWISITAQYSLKMKGRNLDTLKWYFEKTGSTPALMSVGFAAYLLFMRSTANTDGTFSGWLAGKKYTINDQHAGVLHQIWQQHNGIEVVNAVLNNTTLWGESLALPGFAEAVYESMLSLEEKYNIQSPASIGEA